MIPATDDLGLLEIDDVELNSIGEESATDVMPSITYKMTDDKHIKGTIDGVDSIRQSVYKILNTERYAYSIYSGDYGIELDDLYGKPMNYVTIEIKRRIEDALLQDDRILSIDNFSCEQIEKNTLIVSFLVNTTSGEIITINDEEVSL